MTNRTNSKHDPEIAAEICRRVSEGESLRAVCRSPGFPPESSVRTWVRDDREGFKAQYAEARSLQYDSWADAIIEISLDDSLDPADKRVRVDTYKWLLSKLMPKRYGDRLLVAGDDEKPIQLLHKQVDRTLQELSAEQLDALRLFTQQLMIEGKTLDG